MRIPKDFDIDHDAFRPGQLDSINFVRDPNRTQRIILEALTGTGKSAVAASLGSNGHSVRILTATKALQVQYRAYDAEVLFGLANYPCELFKPLKASMCSFPHNMCNCPVHRRCAYLNQRTVTSLATRQALSYQLYLHSSWPRMNPTNYIVLDEVHEVPEIVMNHMALEMSWSEPESLDIDQWPREFKINVDPVKKRDIANWLGKSYTTISDEMRSLGHLIKTDEKAARRVSFLRDYQERFWRVHLGLTSHPEAYFIEVREKKLRIIPLTARHDFEALFMKGMPHKALLMSATIGNPSTFAKILGINEYDFMEVPSNFAPHEMPVWVFKNAPRMNHQSETFAKIKQAKMIANLIKEHNPAWNVLIHVSSKKQAADLANRLGKLGLQDRVWLPPLRGGTEAKYKSWEERLKKVPNTICISWTFHEGIDAWFCHMVIIAKVPFPTLDDLGQAKMAYDPRYYKWRTAVKLMQAAGRNRRGEPEHYEAEGEPTRKVVAVIDGNYKQVLNWLSPHFKDCLVLR